MAQISHHFLSEETESPEEQACPFVNLVLLHPPGQTSDFSLTTLANGLCLHGAPAVAVIPQHPAPVVSYYAPPGIQNIAHDQVFETMQTKLNTPPPPFRYILQASSEAAPDLTDKQCLLLAHASHDGLRDAYSRLKQIAEKNPPAVIGITISHASNIKTARYHYNKLAIAARRFLGLSVRSYGALPTAHESWARSVHQPEPPEDCINNIARMIIQDWIDYQLSKTMGRNIL